MIKLTNGGSGGEAIQLGYNDVLNESIREVMDAQIG